MKKKFEITLYCILCDDATDVPGRFSWDLLLTDRSETLTLSDASKHFPCRRVKKLDFPDCQECHITGGLNRSGASFILQLLLPPSSTYLLPLRNVPYITRDSRAEARCSATIRAIIMLGRWLGPSEQQQRRWQLSHSSPLISPSLSFTPPPPQTTITGHHFLSFSLSFSFSHCSYLGCHMGN